MLGVHDNDCKTRSSAILEPISLGDATATLVNVSLTKMINEVQPSFRPSGVSRDVSFRTRNQSGVEDWNDINLKESPILKTQFFSDVDPLVELFMHTEYTDAELTIYSCYKVCFGVSNLATLQLSLITDNLIEILKEVHEMDKKVLDKNDFITTVSTDKVGSSVSQSYLMKTCPAKNNISNKIFSRTPSLKSLFVAGKNSVHETSYAPTSSFIQFTPQKSLCEELLADQYSGHLESTSNSIVVSPNSFIMPSYSETGTQMSNGKARDSFPRALKNSKQSSKAADSKTVGPGDSITHKILVHDETGFKVPSAKIKEKVQQHEFFNSANSRHCGVQTDAMSNKFIKIEAQLDEFHRYEVFGNHFPCSKVKNTTFTSTAFRGNDNRSPEAIEGQVNITEVPANLPSSTTSAAKVIIESRNPPEVISKRAVKANVSPKNYVSSAVRWAEFKTVNTPAFLLTFFLLTSLSFNGAMAKIRSRDDSDPVSNIRHVLPELELGNNSVTDVRFNEGSTAFLPCRFPTFPRHHENRVSWIRRWDWNILTAGIFTYTNDDRFVVLHKDGTNDWTLQIKFLQTHDNGTYECQVHTGSGFMSQFVNLHVITPRAVILEPSEFTIETGQDFSLTCVIQQSLEPPVYVMWLHGGVPVNYAPDRPRLDVQLIVKGATSRSVLSVKNAKYTDSGNYTCTAPNAVNDWVLVYITQGDTVAAVQRRQPNSSKTAEVEGAPALPSMANAAQPLLSTFRVSFSNVFRQLPDVLQPFVDILKLFTDVLKPSANTSNPSSEISPIFTGVLPSRIGFCEKSVRLTELTGETYVNVQIQQHVFETQCLHEPSKQEKYSVRSILDTINYIPVRIHPSVSVKRDYTYQRYIIDVILNVSLYLFLLQLFSLVLFESSSLGSFSVSQLNLKSSCLLRPCSTKFQNNVVNEKSLSAEVCRGADRR
ncbi:uncharacterized protein LOC108664677 [Hyalella azteca]|uniref:Uncharacterized protein LOC108664677 n=1 Tax=Hyalella azteca TaxID=294128 RepID=A0A8B7MZ50_HYAAZ|nr:uncharacterized protein LOC108664677 [Hyalella azteca]